MSTVKKALDYIQSLAFFYIISIALHEWGHVAAGWIFNVKMIVIYKPDLSGIAKWTTYPHSTLELAVIGVAGGMTVCILYMLALIFESDREDRLALCIIGMGHGFYAIGEVFAVLNIASWSLPSTLFVVGMAVGFLVWSHMFWKKTT